MKENLGIDLDGCVTNIYDDALRILRELYPNKVKYEITGSMLEEAYGLTPKEVENCFIELNRRGGYRRARIYPGAKETLYKLNKLYSINFITSRDFIPGARDTTLYWLDSNKIPYEKLILTNNKHKVAIRDNYCFFLDDNIKQCNRLAKTTVPTFLFARPWNQAERYSGTDALVKIVYDWKSIENILLYNYEY